MAEWPKLTVVAALVAFEKLHESREVNISVCVKLFYKMLK